MTTQLPDPQAIPHDPEAQALTLRPSPALTQLPAPTPVAVEVPVLPGQLAPVAPEAAHEPTKPKLKLLAEQLPTGSWAVASVALLATLGWLVRRRRRLRAAEEDSDIWADVHSSAKAHVSTGLDDILPASRDPAEAAGSIYLSAIGDTTSRREATLIDLHQLAITFWRRRERGDTVAAILLLQQHLVDFRFTSPWVFLELRELYKVLDLQREWEMARGAFSSRFGQNAPEWSAPSTADAELAVDPQLCKDLVRGWPHRMARMFILRWMLGVHEMRQKSVGPPLLALGVYRDLMMLDAMLDDVMASS